jgi:hypothetical protein
MKALLIKMKNGERDDKLINNWVIDAQLMRNMIRNCYETDTDTTVQSGGE